MLRVKQINESLSGRMGTRVVPRKIREFRPLEVWRTYRQGMGSILYLVRKERETMKEKLDSIMKNALSQIEDSKELDKLNDIRVAFLGKKGELTSVLKSHERSCPGRQTKSRSAGK